MIVIDSSALMAILFDEPERRVFQNVIAGEQDCRLSAVNGHETACVLRGRHGPAGVPAHPRDASRHARHGRWPVGNGYGLVADRGNDGRGHGGQKAGPVQEASLTFPLCTLRARRLDGS